MPRPRSSALIAWVSPASPNFEITYPAPAFGDADFPASETMFTIVPAPRRRISRQECLRAVIRAVQVRLDQSRGNP